MFHSIEDMMDELRLSPGEVLALARQIAGEDIRTIDRLTAAERRELMLAIERQHALALA